MRGVVLAFAFAAVVLALDVDPSLDAKCQDWVLRNQKDLSMLNQVASQSHIASCQQYCMIAGSGFRSDTTTCRTLCDTAGGFENFSQALSLEDGLANPGAVCTAMFKPLEVAVVDASAPVSLLEVSSRAAAERKLGVRGDMTVQGTLSTSILTSPIGDVKVSGEMNVMNHIESNSARAAFLKADAGVSIKHGIVSKKEQLLIKGRIDADSVTAETFHASSFLQIDGVKQWSLYSLEDFEVEVEGWSDKEVTECAGRKILGGHCVGSSGSKEVTKTFNNLPPHSQIRINAQYLFLDSWDGESGYLKLNENVVWTESYHHKTGEESHGINVCGNETPEKKFNRPIDVIVPHTAKSLTVTFGATTDEHPCDESFGIDSVMVFLR